MGQVIALAAAKDLSCDSRLDQIGGAADRVGYDTGEAMVQGFETRQPLWFERSRSLQLQADNILLQMRLRRSLEAAGR